LGWVGSRSWDAGQRGEVRDPLRTDRGHLSVRLSVMNVTNKVALYNFLSTFSGIHFVPPRTVQMEVKWTF
jgi:outer membrane receptor protein involved in Fe transport